MTVMVTGASGVVGRALVPRLLQRDEVRACVRRPASAEPLRSLGAKVAVGVGDDVDALVEILPRVVTLIHLAAGPNQTGDEDVLGANHRAALTAVSAARAAGVPRFVLASVPDASPDAADPYLRAMGLAEEAVATSGLDHAIIRCSHVYGLGGLWFTAVVNAALSAPPLALGSAPVAPVFAEDVAAVLAAVEDRPGTLSATWALEGPEPISPSDLVRKLVGGEEPVEILSTVGAHARMERLLGVTLTHEAVDHLLRPARADAPDASEAFGVVLTALDDGLRSVIEAAVASAASEPTDRDGAG
jgi:uncharacterized protein YbjT (DUF2867 family)